VGLISSVIRLIARSITSHTRPLCLLKKKKGGTRRILALPAGDLGKWRSMQVALMCVQKRVDGGSAGDEESIRRVTLSLNSSSSCSGWTTTD
jgi:hypothetical protein